MRLARICKLVALPLFAAALSTLVVPIATSQTPAPSLLPATPAPPPPIDFDVVTFKLNKTGQPTPKITIPPNGDGFTAQNRPMHDLIRYAFSKARGGSYHLSGYPSWVDDDHYDIQAKVAPEDLAAWQDLGLGQQKLVLQTFLIKFLKLKYHPDPTPYTYYALVIGKSGTKFRKAKPDETFKTSDGQTISGRAVLFSGANEITSQVATIEQLADLLSGHADRLVIDKTGLTGMYSFVLHFDETPDPKNPDGPGIAFPSLPPDAATPAMFAAVKQLGLELKPTKGPTEGIVIDHIERPPEN